ncbi:hypothetical protein PENTCL1PPCAC_13540, partial [Pristionchus entomophagus]
VAYEAVCVIFEHWLAQLEKFDSLKLCGLGFSRVLKTMGVSILHLVATLAPDDVTTLKCDIDVTSSGANVGIDLFELCQT